MRFPQSVHLETLNSCNAKCIMCPATTTARVRGTMTDATFNRIVAQVLELPQKPSVTLHGTGEPLLYKKLGERIKAFSKHGIKVHLTSNGSIMTRNRAFEVIDAGVATIGFSIESLNKGIYEKIRVGLDLDEVIANVLSCVELRNRLNPKISIKMIFIAHEDNRETIEEYSQFCLKHLSVGDELITVPRHNFANTFDSEIATGDLSCGFPLDSIHILYDGVVNLCCVDSEVHHDLGNVNESTILEIFNNKLYSEIRAAHEAGRRDSVSLCATCNVPEALVREKSFVIAREGAITGLRPLN